MALAGNDRARPAPFRSITDYYEQCEVDYRWLWDLDHSLAMHIGHWDASTRTLRDALRRQNLLLADLARVAAGDRVLDAGCGVGGSAIFLAETRGCRVVGVTLSQHQARAALGNAGRRRVRERTAFARMDYAATGLAPETFDVFWALESTCYCRDRRALAREAHRLLRPGGRVVVADGFAVRAAYDPADEQVMRRWMDGWAVSALPTLEDFERALAEAGFRNVGFLDCSANIEPSSRRLYWHSLYGLPLGRVAERLGLRSRVQTSNIVGARAQRAVLRRGLLRYGVFTAEKGDPSSQGRSP